ncbi:aldo/keto reductase [Diplocloster hominis]|uniref:aldo/keto reductase n=1 Tax=Diplocloster hominis TaxID=3079010 RepID=UPI0031BA762A
MPRTARILGTFAEGGKDFFTNPILNDIGAIYGKTTAQVALRYLIQKNIVVIPKSVHKERMAQNFDVFDFVLDSSDIQAIAALDEQESAFFSHYDPETVEFLTGMAK